VQDVINEIHEDAPKARAHTQLGQKPDMHHEHGHHHEVGACPGSRAVTFEPKTAGGEMHAGEQPSQLGHWPVQMHLINPVAPYYRNTDVLIAADCVAFAMGNFHSRFLKGKSLAIACPKLDSNTEIYIEKITRMIDEAQVNTLTVMIMEVPCCGGLLQMVMKAAQAAGRKVPVKAIKVSLKGEVLSETWM
jgi:hypothetical protein